MQLSQKLSKALVTVSKYETIIDEKTQKIIEMKYEM